MDNSKKILLKPGREQALRNRHTWIFSGAIASFPDFENGEILPVYSSSGDFLAKAYFHAENSISGRVLTFLDESAEKAESLATIQENLKTQKELDKKNLREAKFISPKKLPIKFDFTVFDDKVKFEILHGKLGAIIIQNKDIAQSFKNLFDFIWGVL